MARRGKETGSRDLPYQDKDRYATRLISGATCYLQPPPPSQGSILALDIQQRFSAGHSSIKSSATCFSQDFPLQRCRPDFRPSSTPQQRVHWWAIVSTTPALQRWLGTRCPMPISAAPLLHSGQ
jgi:hypothetical protein